MSAAALLTLGQIVGLTLLVSVPFLLLAHWAALQRGAGVLARRCGLVRPALPPPPGQPIERIAADVRRIGHELKHAPAGLPVARLAGWREAYDDALLAACRSLRLDTELAELPHGVRRDLERLRVERMLDAAGLRTDPAA